MNIDSIREYCLSFPQAAEKLQWGDDLCFKAGGKIFAILGLDSVPARLCFKCTPEKFGELCEREGIVPAPYVGRYKWVLVRRLDALDGEELRELIGQSHAMVTAGKPKGKISSRRAGRVSRKKKG